MTTTKANVNFSSHGFHKNTSMAIFHKLNSSKHRKVAKYTTTQMSEDTHS